jgi:hypothetical protein
VKLSPWPAEIVRITEASRLLEVAREKDISVETGTLSDAQLALHSELLTAWNKAPPGGPKKISMRSALRKYGSSSICIVTAHLISSKMSLFVCLALQAPAS